MPTNIDKLATLLTTVKDLASFQPTDDQKRARSRFWAHFGSNEGDHLPPTPHLATALRFGGDKRISTWWELPNFQDWFWNAEEFRARIEYLADVALDSLEEIITTKTALNSDKLNAIKLIMSVAEKMPSGKGGAESGSGMLDKAIAQMGRVQLEEYIRSNMALLQTSQSNPYVEPDGGVIARSLTIDVDADTVPNTGK